MEVGQSVMNKGWKWVLIGAILAGMLMAGYVAWARNGVEQANKEITAVLDWKQVKELAARENIPEQEVLEEFRGKITGVLFKETTLNDLKAKGDLLFKTGIEMKWDLRTGASQGLKLKENDQEEEIQEDWTYLVFADEESMERVQRNLSLKLADQNPQLLSCYLQTPQGVMPVLGTSLSLNDIILLGVGFEEEDLSLVRSVGLQIIPQIRFWRNVTEESLEVVFGQFQDMPVSAVFFNDREVPGIGLPIHRQKEALKAIAHQIEGLHVPLGMIEFLPQKGISMVGQYLEKNMVRMHSIGEAEMLTTTQSQAVERYTLAAAERDIRVLLVRLIPGMGIKDLNNYLAELKTSLEDKGYQLGYAQGFGSLPFSRLYLALIGLGVTAGGMLLLEQLKLRRLGLLLGALGFIAFLGLLFIGEISIARKAMALMSVIIFPTLSVTLCLGEKSSGLGNTILQFIKMALISWIGALLMVGLLGDKTFMYTLDQFMGVKLAHVVPLFLIVLIFYVFKSSTMHPLKKAGQVLDYPIAVKHVILLGILGIVLLIYLMRTGNDSGTVSAWELALRSGLGDLLAVRPRTKEFLIGHPLMFLLIYLGYRDKYLPILVVGMIGQVSLVNTFAHIHTPIVISLLRAFNGLWLGILVGLLLIGLIKVGQKLMVKIQTAIEAMDQEEVR
ncbi:DUF5693 family protein [Dehalobacterium formicoaceticum]|uniref:DUF5693 family protein n=1 Tax=Dehalobacterium formicoaceticum TaxID=51515 RepID=UPI000B7DE686|nr:DUF5693 family protein [Dehalobacterium formicoaceticum]